MRVNACRKPTSWRQSQWLVAVQAPASAVVRNWLVEGASGSGTAGFDGTGWKRTYGWSFGESRVAAVEVPVVGSPRPRKADNAELGLATAALVETPATVGSRRVNGATTQGWKCRQRLFGAASTRVWVS